MKKTQAVSAGIAFVLAITLTLHAQTAFSVRTVSTPTVVQSAQADSIVGIVAEAQGLQLVPPEEVPPCGTFWTVLPEPGGGVIPPFPCPPLDPSLPIYAIADGQFLVDGTIGSQASLNVPQAGRLVASSTSTAALGAQADAVVNLITQVQTAAANRQMRAMVRAMGMDVPSPGGDGSGDGGDGSLPMFNNIFRIDTNAMWLEITNVSGGVAYLNLHNATNQVYGITSKSNFLSASWNIEQEVWPTNPAVMPFTVPVLGRTSMLFIRAQDWTGVDDNGDGIPNWWIWKYFGTLDLSATNLDGQGNTLLYDYQNGIDPNIISFLPLVTNNYVKSMSVLVQLNILRGVPSSVAVAVDDTNYAADANWQVYTGTNVAVNLGLNEGWHEVWIGLRGLPSGAQQTWQWKRLKLDLTPPLLVITNPIVGVVTQPMIQLQGYSPEALSGISYDLTNAVGLVTNQQVLVLDQFYSTNTWEFTTNTWQAFDVPLTNGLNTIILHATDLAGNTTTTNFSFTLDYSGKTNLPGVQIGWPQDGTQISGGSFTLDGQVDDPTVTVSASITDTNGNANMVAGLVERNGRFWVENLPLNAGTNVLTLTVADAAGNVTTTNISVAKSSLVLTMNPVSGDNLWHATVDVDGTISDASQAVWVNGVKGTNHGNGTWSASNVPVNQGGTACFTVTAYAPAEQQPDGSFGN